MAKTDWPEERENSERAVFLTGEIDAAAFERIAPQIIKLRLASSEPISVYIHSVGGNPAAAEKILRLIRAPRQDGKKCLVTTVCMGLAASAAADMLSAGDYAIAYADSAIVVHGTREQHDEITIETAREIALRVDQANEYFAMKLASRMFRRFATQALLLEAFKENPPRKNVMAVGANPSQILSKIRESVSDEHTALLDAAVDRMERIKTLVGYIHAKNEGKSDDGDGDPIAAQTQMVKHLVDFEAEVLRENRKNGLPSDSFSGETIQLIRDDFERLNDFVSGKYWTEAESLSRHKGQFFLTPEEIKEFSKLPKGDERDKYLVWKAAPKIFPMWYVVSSLCRLLQNGEHVFSSHDAWWFGLVDEVPGTELPSLRSWRERGQSSLPPPRTTLSTDSPSG